MTEETPDSFLTALCKNLEHWETPEWPIHEILKVELLGSVVMDVGTGTGIIARIVFDAGYEVIPLDIQRWEGQPENTIIADFLSNEPAPWQAKFFDGITVIMNPPFSLAEEMVERAIALGARKVVVFQRFAWWESDGRAEFWRKHPPNRIYICGSRATCWRHDIEPADRLDKNGREKSTPTAHAWFVWEKGQPAGTVVGHIYRDKTP